MNNPLQHVSAAEVSNRNRFRNTKSSLKRGQIKSKIVVSVFHFIASVICLASSAGDLHSESHLAWSRAE